MAKHLSNRGLAARDAGVSDSATQGLGGPEGGLISERFEDGSTGDDAPHPPPLPPCGVTAHPESDPRRECSTQWPEWVARGPVPPGASDTAEPRSSTRPSRRNPPCPVLCRAGLACVLDGCWMLDAGARWDADCLGQGIRVGSWLADLSCCCTYNHVPPDFLNKTPIVCLLLLASARFSYSKLRLSLPATHHHCLRASWAPILLFPVSSQAPYNSSTRPVAFSVRPTTSPRSPRIRSHTPSFR